MTDPRVHELLDEPFELPTGEPASGIEEELMRGLVAAGALLEPSVARYRELSGRFNREGTSTELRAAALEAAGDLAAVLGATDRHLASYVTLDETELRPVTLLAVLSELFHSLVLLTEPQGDEFFLEPRISGDELDAMLTIDDLEDWLDPEAALARLRSARGGG